MGDRQRTSKRKKRFWIVVFVITFSVAEYGMIRRSFLAHAVHIERRCNSAPMPSGLNVTTASLTAYGGIVQRSRMEADLDSSSIALIRFDIRASELPVRSGYDSIPGHAGHTWRAESIGPPYHIRFRGDDGSVSEPIDFESVIGSTAQFDDLIRWSADGTAIVPVFDPTMTLQPGANVQNPMFMKLLMEATLKAIAITVMLVFFCWLMMMLAQRLNRQRAGLCIRCGYDLRHLDQPGCPECGTDRATAASNS